MLIIKLEIICSIFIRFFNFDITTKRLNKNRYFDWRTHLKSTHTMISSNIFVLSDTFNITGSSIFAHLNLSFKGNKAKGAHTHAQKKTKLLLAAHLQMHKRAYYPKYTNKKETKRTVCSNGTYVHRHTDARKVRAARIRKIFWSSCDGEFRKVKSWKTRMTHATTTGHILINTDTSFMYMRFEVITSQLNMYLGLFDGRGFFIFNGKNRCSTRIMDNVKVRVYI